MIATPYSPTDQRARIAELEQAVTELEQALAEEQALRTSVEDRMLALMSVVEHPKRPSARALLLTVYADYCSYFGQPHTRHSLAQAVECSQRTIARSLTELPDLANFLEPVQTELSYEPTQPTEMTTLSPMTELARTKLSNETKLARTKLSPAPDLARTDLSPQPVVQRTKLSSKPATTRTNLSHQAVAPATQRTKLSNETEMTRTNLSPVAHAEDRFVPQLPMTNLASQHDSSSDIYNYNNFEATNRQNESRSNISSNFNNLFTTNRRNESLYTNPSQELDVTNRHDELSRFTGLEGKQRRIVQPESAETTLSPRKQEHVRTGLPFKGAAPYDIYQCIIDYSRLMSDYGPDAERINVSRIRAYYQVAVPDKMTHEQFYALMQEASEKAAHSACRSLKQLPDGNTVIARMKIFWAIFESMIGFKIRKGHIESMLN